MDSLFPSIGPMRHLPWKHRADNARNVVRSLVPSLDSCHLDFRHYPLAFAVACSTQLSESMRLPLYNPFPRYSCPSFAISSSRSTMPQPPVVIPAGLSSHSAVSSIQNEQKSNVDINIHIQHRFDLSSNIRCIVVDKALHPPQFGENSPSPPRIDCQNYRRSSGMA